ncbi:hypothetical protein OROGR_008326 [Orobanche gracilis]
MEERLPSYGPTNDHPPSLPPPTEADLETYVVQIPRDQIYRIPPPEHARIVERYLDRGSNNPTTTCRRTLCWAATIPIILTVVALVAVFAIRATLYNPTPPVFAVARIHAKNLEHPSNPRRLPEFDLTLLAENPNARLSVSYGGGTGEASLVYRNHKIGKGKIRSTIRQDPGGRAIDFPVALVGNGVAMSPEIEKGLINGSTEKSMAMKIEVAIEMNSWVRNELKNIKISCDFRVKNLLTNKNKISFQECRTEF